MKNKIRNIRTTAIVIKDTRGNLVETMKGIREKIDIKKYEFTTIKTKKSLAGNIVLELDGDTTGQKTKELKEEICKYADEKENIHVYMPEKTVEVMIRNLDVTLEAHDVKTLLAKECGVEINNISVGKTNDTRNGRTIWAKCPLKALSKLFRQKGTRQLLGWATVDIEILKARPLQCFKCWGYGHIAPHCKDSTDYSGWCYKCGTKGHSPGICISPPGCQLCREAQEEWKHRMGSKDCSTLRKYLTKNGGVAERSRGVAEHKKSENLPNIVEEVEKENEENRKQDYMDTHLQEDIPIVDDTMTETDDDKRDLDKRTEVYV